jgi:hypothetical protein
MFPLFFLAFIPSFFLSTFFLYPFLRLPFLLSFHSFFLTFRFSYTFFRPSSFHFSCPSRDKNVASRQLPLEGCDAPLMLGSRMLGVTSTSPLSIVNCFHLLFLLCYSLCLSSHFLPDVSIGSDVRHVSLTAT